MKYFLHDTSAFQDEKISQLFIKFGYEGIGLFFTLLEKIALQEKPVNSDVLKKQLYIGKKLKKCWDFMEEIGLISTKNGETFNENLLNFSEKYQIKKEKTRKKVSEWRKKQKEIDKKSINFHESLLKFPTKFHESFTKVSLNFDESLDVFQEKINKLKLEGIENEVIEKIVTGYKTVRNQPKVKESKVNNINISPKIFYDSEIKKIENIVADEKKKREYQKVVAFLFGNNSAKCELSTPLKMPKQISFEQYCKLSNKADFETICNKLYALQNNKKYENKYKDLYMTMQNWLSYTDKK